MVNYAAEKFQIGENVSLSLGLMYVTSGIGTAYGISVTFLTLNRIGPVVVELFVPNSTRNNVLTMVVAFVSSNSCNFSLVQAVMIVGSLIRAYCTNFILFCLFNMMETSCSSCIWVYSSSILQRLVPNHLMGRCSSFEEASKTVASITSKVLYAFLRDTAKFSSVSIIVGFILGGGLPLLGLWVAFVVATKGTDLTPFQALQEEEKEDSIQDIQS